jgi:mono/diheme cytochrome c family protein
MANQPSYRPLQPGALFANGMSARPLPKGVIARQWMRSQDPLSSGLKAEYRGALAALSREPVAKGGTPTADAPTDPGRFVTNVPFELTGEDLERGQERYTIFCAVCHDPVGTGHGKIIERGYVRPPNYHTENSRGFARYGKSIPLRDVPAGYVFEVITHGYGAMPRYAPQIAPRDRWRIVAYVRALQLSQYAVLDELPPDDRKVADEALRSTQ